jgi:hypothetical protein
MKRQAIWILAALVLSGPVAVHGQGETARNRADDDALLRVARLVLQNQNGLLLGPVRWITPSREAAVSVGARSSLLGRAGYNMRRGFLGRWHLTPFIRE